MFLNNDLAYYKSCGSFSLDKRVGSFQQSLLQCSNYVRALLEENPLYVANQLQTVNAEGRTALNPSDTDRNKKENNFHHSDAFTVIFLTAVLIHTVNLIRCIYLPEDIALMSENDNVASVDVKDVTFDDANGFDDARLALQKIMAILRSPDKFAGVGKLPKGILLVGPNGTDKALLARAVADEAKVPFFQLAISTGSELKGHFLGEGARRARNLFRTAKANAPCAIFIDEIDFIGSAQVMLTENPVAIETITQLLSEMDGLDPNDGVIVLWSANRRYYLYRALLLRPGRFDVEVQVPVPDLIGRKCIIEYYLGKVKRSSDVDVDAVARATTGLTGGDLEKMVNQAALQAATEGANSIGMKHLEFAQANLGIERKSMEMGKNAKWTWDTAYRDHAFVAFSKEPRPSQKDATIFRESSLGHTLAEKEDHSSTTESCNSAEKMLTWNINVHSKEHYCTVRSTHNRKAPNPDMKM